MLLQILGVDLRRIHLERIEKPKAPIPCVGDGRLVDGWVVRGRPGQLLASRTTASARTVMPTAHASGVE